VRVAVVSPYDLAAFGGVQDQVISLVCWLRARGHEAFAVAPGSGGPEGTIGVGAVTGVRANRSTAPITLDPRAVRRVAQAVADCDVVHVHEPLMPMASLAVLLADTPPRVGTFHADPGALGRGVYRGARPVLRRLVGRLRVSTAVSPVAQHAVAGFTDARIVPNALDIGAYRPDTAKVPGRVVFVGRDEPRKGLDDLLQAWPLVRSRHPDAELHVVGAERPAGPDRVVFLGRIAEEEKRRELAEAEVLCAPNLGGESFGIILVEGMASGCALVASDLEAFRAVAGDVARLVPGGDVAGLGKAISAALTEPAEGGAAALAAAPGFGHDAVFPRYLEAYRQGCAGS